jgi:hypothetical protein
MSNVARRRPRHEYLQMAQLIHFANSIHLRLLEKLFWVSVVISGFVCAGFIISTSVADWMNDPGIVSITTFSKVSL